MVDTDKVEEETAAYEPIPLITDFKDDTPDKSKMKAAIQFNYNQVKQDVKDIVAKNSTASAATRLSAIYSVSSDPGPQ